MTNRSLPAAMNILKYHGSDPAKIAKKLEITVHWSGQLSLYPFPFEYRFKTGNSFCGREKVLVTDDKTKVSCKDCK